MNRIFINRQTLLSVFVAIARILLGCVFIYSSLPKVYHPYTFLGPVYAYQLVGPKMGVLVAMVLPWLELLVGICLVGGVFVGGALLVSTSMGLLFAAVLASALHHHLGISCGCFGSSSTDKINHLTLIRALILTLLSAAAYAAVIAARPFSTRSLGDGSTKEGTTA